MRNVFLLVVVLCFFAISGCAEGRRIAFTWEPGDAPAEVGGAPHESMPPGGVAIGVAPSEARQLDCAAALAVDREILIRASVDAEGGAGDYTLSGRAVGGAESVDTGQWWRWAARAPVPGSGLEVCVLPVVRK